MAEADQLSREEAAQHVAAPLEEGEKGPLPQLEELVERVPSQLRTDLRELLGAEFTRVVRVPRRVLVQSAKAEATATGGSSDGPGDELPDGYDPDED